MEDTKPTELCNDPLAEKHKHGSVNRICDTIFSTPDLRDVDKYQLDTYLCSTLRCETQ